MEVDNIIRIQVSLEDIKNILEGYCIDCNGYRLVGDGTILGKRWILDKEISHYPLR